MQVDILTLFPEMFTGPFSSSILKKASERGLLKINLVDIRDFSANKHHTVDDTPYGGGPGMVMGTEAVSRAIESVTGGQAGSPGRVVLLCPQGRPFSQGYAKDLAAGEHIILVCGHYEGIDERVRETLVADEISIGDYVLTGGEIPAMVLVDAVARLVPGVLGEPASAEEDSFSSGLLEHPHYTRPREFRSLGVPDVLLSGHHEEIRRWRRRQSLLRTLERRPELLSQVELTREDKKIFKELFRELEKLQLE